MVTSSSEPCFGQKKNLQFRRTTGSWWTIQDSNLCMQAVSRPAYAAYPPLSRLKSPAAMRSQVRESLVLGKRKTCSSEELQVYGGRYKTRTCDLPHVKRMRYQLRQSSSSLKQGVFYTIECKMSRIILHFSEKICTLAESRGKRQENGVCRKTDSVFC